MNALPEKPPLVRYLGLQPYPQTWREMREFTDLRGIGDPDQIWVVRHAPVFTLGQAGKEEHLLAPGDIPVVKSDRGGQVTYHGPGQLVIYLLLDLRRYRLGVRDFVSLIETSIIDFLAIHGVKGRADPQAPGVYVGEKKIASLGLRIRRGCSYHGLSLNLDMDLEPYSRINVCGHPGLGVTQLTDLVKGLPDQSVLSEQLVNCLLERLGYTAGTEQRE